MNNQRCLDCGVSASPLHGGSLNARRPWLAACLLLAALTLSARSADATPLDEAAERYRPFMIEGIGQALAGARNLRERIAAKDLTGARKAWISARAGWERSEV